MCARTCTSNVCSNVVTALVLIALSSLESVLSSLEMAEEGDAYQHEFIEVPCWKFTFSEYGMVRLCGVPKGRV